MDTTKDINRTYQMSQIIRYVSVSKDEAETPTSLKMNGRFLGFVEIADETGLGFKQS